MRKRNALLLSLAILQLFGMTTIQVGAQTTTISVDPRYTSSHTSEFTIEVSISHVTDLYGFQLKLGYNTTILDIVRVDIQPFLKEPTYVVANETHEDEGWYSLAILSYQSPTGVDGSGPLVALTFKVMSLGNCTLNLYEIVLSNSKAEEIPHEAIDGEVTTEEPAEPEPEPVDYLPYVAIVIVVVILAAVAIYFLKIRKS